MGAVLIWPGAIAIGVSLGLLGSGGSILTVPVLVYLVGQDEKLAIASSLAIVGVIAFTGSISYIKEKLVEWRSVWLFGIPGMTGTYVGAWSAAFVSGEFQLAIFALVMIAAAFFMIQPDRATIPQEKPCRSALWIGLDGTAVGAVTGFVGVGGGFLIVPALVLLGGLSMHRAVATSLVIISLKSAVGFIKYEELMRVSGIRLDYEIIGFVAALGIIGSYIGANVAQQLPKEKLQRGFGGFLIVMGVYILATSVPAILV